MTKTCTVVATFSPVAGQLSAVRSFLLNAAIEVRTEQGCLFYDLYEEIGGQLLFIESWTSREAWQVHNGAPSVTKIVNFLDGKLARPALVQEMYLAEN